VVSVIFAPIVYKQGRHADARKGHRWWPILSCLTVAKGSLPLAWQHAASQRAPLMRDRGKCQFVPNSAAGIPLEKT
jgi:hypothetical protein